MMGPSKPSFKPQARSSAGGALPLTKPANEATPEKKSGASVPPPAPSSKTGAVASGAPAPPSGVPMRGGGKAATTAAAAAVGATAVASTASSAETASGAGESAAATTVAESGDAAVALSPRVAGKGEFANSWLGPKYTKRWQFTAIMLVLGAAGLWLGAALAESLPYAAMRDPTAKISDLDSQMVTVGYTPTSSSGKLVFAVEDEDGVWSEHPMSVKGDVIGEAQEFSFRLENRPKKDSELRISYRDGLMRSEKSIPLEASNFQLAAFSQSDLKPEKLSKQLSDLERECVTAHGTRENRLKQEDLLIEDAPMLATLDLPVVKDPIKTVDSTHTVINNRNFITKGADLYSWRNDANLRTRMLSVFGGSQDTQTAVENGLD